VATTAQVGTAAVVGGALANGTPAPVCVIMGDLNALLRADYTQQQWKRIEDVRIK